MDVKNRNLISAGVCIIMLAAFAVLNYYVRMASDDFYYATFCTGGLGEFIEKTVYHYQNLTGRAFVHILLCPMLLFDMIPFRIWNTLLIGFVTYLSARIASGGRSGVVRFWALALVLFPLIGAATLGDGALWGAGSFNYLFPTVLAALCFFLLKKYVSAQRGGWGVLIVVFLTSATVEMTGILVPITVLYVFFSEYRTAKRRVRYMAANFAAACVGYATLFGTGGIASRLSQNGYYSIGIFRRAVKNYELFSRMIMDGGGIYLIILAVLVSICVYFLLRKKYISAFSALALAALPVLTGTGAVWSSLGIALSAGACAAGIFAFGIYAFVGGERVVPFFALMTFLSLGVCLISPIVGMRMILPSAVFLIMFALRTLAISGMSEKALCLSGAAVLVPAAAVMFVFVTKYAANAAVIDANELAASSYDGSGTLYLQNVPDERYGHGTVPSQGNFGEYFCQLNGITAVIENYDADTVIMSCNGETLENPAIERDGEWYVAVRDVGTVIGAETRWEYSYAVVDTGEEYRFHLNSRAVLIGGCFGRCEKLLYPVRMVNETTYISVDDANRIFGIEIGPE